MQKLVWQNANGVELDLTSGNYGITEWEGFSNASLNIQQQQVPFQDGGVFLDALIEQRELSVTLAMQDNNNLALRYQQRRELISALNPKLGEGYLIYTNDFISKRIKCVPQIPLFETHNSDTAGTPKASLTWTACEPYWEDLEETEVYVQDGRQTIINNGDIPCEVGIKLLLEDSKDIKINNITTQEQIGLLENEHKSGDVYINTKVGKKEVVLGKKDYILNTIFNQFFRKIKYFESLQYFFVVGDNGLILTSKNGIDYSYVNAESLWNMDFSNIAYSETKDILCVIGEKIGIIKYDRKEDTFSVIYSLGVLEKLNSVAYFEVTESFYAVGEDGILIRIYYRLDIGIWDIEEITSFTDKTLYDISFVDVGTIGGKYLIVVGEDGLIYKTYNGENWTAVTQSLITDDIEQVFGTNNLKSMLEQERLFFRTTDKIYISDIFGQNVELYKDFTGYKISSMDLADYTLVVSAKQITPTNIKIFTNNIITQIEWNEMLSPDRFTSIEMIGCAYSRQNGIYVFFSQWGTKFINSSNVMLPTEWEEKIEPILGNITGICETEDTMFAVTSLGRIYKSVDGNRWKEIDTPNRLGTFYGICYSEKLKTLVAIGYTENNHNNITISQDNGNSWTITSTDERALRSVVYSKEGESFVAVGDNGLVKTSVDGINWVTGDNTGHSLKCVIWVYDEDITLYVAGGSDGSILTSNGGMNWVQRASYNGSINGIAYSKINKLFLAVGSTDGLIISNNGLDWSIRSGGDSSNMNDIIYHEEESCFYVVGNTFVLQTINVIGANSYRNPFTLEKIFYSKILKNIMLGGNSGVILTQSVSKKENIVDVLSKDSNLNFNLVTGENIVNVTTREGLINMKLTYRQKYIGV